MSQELMFDLMHLVILSAVIIYLVYLLRNIKDWKVWFCILILTGNVLPKISSGLSNKEYSILTVAYLVIYLVTISSSIFILRKFSNKN